MIRQDFETRIHNTPNNLDSSLIHLETHVAHAQTNPDRQKEIDARQWWGYIKNAKVRPL